jgi:hypothetical protein
MTNANLHVDLLDINADGHLLQPDGRATVPHESVPQYLEQHLRLREETTDIFLYVHGWRTSADAAITNARKLFTLVDSLMAQQPHSYARIRDFQPQYVCVRWPSADKWLPLDYETVRDRTESMSHDGHVPRLLGSVLGYFNDHREPPETNPDVLTGAYGQYLHCIGHSFGSRFLLHAILQATARLAAGGPDTLAWNWEDSAYPWTLDSLTLFQAALPADSFSQPPYSDMLTHNVLNAPVVMTYSPSDTALGFYHERSEKQVALGYLGATAPAQHIERLAINDIQTPYELPKNKRLLNVDASQLFVRGNRLLGGAHSDFYRPEAAHLLLSLAQAAR